MRGRRRWIAWLVLGFGLSGGGARAEELPVRASDQWPRLTIPAGLPRSDIDARLDLGRRFVLAREQVRFTNRSKVPASELVVHLYPRSKVSDQDRAILSKTLEILRLSPDAAMDSDS